MAITKTAQAYTDPTAANGLAAFTAASTAVGNACFLCMFVGSSTVKASSIAGTGFTWTQLGAGFASTTVPGGANYNQIWMGVATSVQSTAQTQTVTYSASNSALYTGLSVIGEFTNGTGASTTWALDGSQSGGQTNASAASIIYPTRTATAAGELYVGVGDVGSGGVANTTGTPAGYTFLSTPSATQPAVYAVLAAAGSTGTVTQTKAAAQITASYSVLVTATGPAVAPTGGFFPFMNHHEQQALGELWTPEKPRLIAPRRRTHIDLAPRVLVSA